MDHRIFAVADEPYFLWEEDCRERSVEFLNGLDPGFFTYLLETHAAAKDEKRASAGIRIALHHAVETMFSLLGAFFQAPGCSYAWISRCQTEQLRNVVRRIGSNDESLISPWVVRPIGWAGLADIVFQRFKPGTEENRFAVQGFSNVWARMSGDFLNELVSDEYNATKHGFRMTLGGFSAEISTKPATASPEDLDMVALAGGSEFGAMFLKVDKLTGAGGRHLQSRRIAVNWSMEQDAALLHLAHLSIHNVVSALKFLNGVPSTECTYAMPLDKDAFEMPWRHGPGLVSMTVDRELDPSTLPDVTKAELLEKLRAMNKAEK